jgi:hypothetical protein
MRATTPSYGRRGPRRAVVLAVALATGLTLPPAATAHAEPVPSGSMGVMFGVGSGTGKYAHKLGLGYYEFAGQAAWQPMNTEQRLGWSLKWAFVFGRMYGADAARIDIYLRTLQMDFMAGLRFRPGANLRRYLALRGGVELFRSNEVIERNQRAFVGPVAAAAFEQYFFGWFLFNLDVRYGLIGSGPAEIAVLSGVSLAVW